MSGVRVNKPGIGTRLLANMLERFIQRGTLRVIDATGSMTEFVGTEEPVATIRLHDPDLRRRICKPVSWRGV